MSIKNTKIIFWITTALVALFVVPSVLFVNSQQALDGMNHLGLPRWFNYELSIGKSIGGLILLLPFIPKRIKEWAYVALGIDMLSAVIALVSVDGAVPKSFAPLVGFAILLLSYISYHKLQSSKEK